MTSGYPSGLTASAIEASIAFYWSPEACDQVQERLREASELIATGLLVQNEDNRYELTDRGRVFVRHLLDTPLPVQWWEVRRHSASVSEPK